MAIAIGARETEMEHLHQRRLDMFSFANAWAERYDAIIARVPRCLARVCNDPLISCSGVPSQGDTHERNAGRRDQALDGAVEVRAGAGNIQGKTTVSEASRQFELAPSEIEGWIEDVREQYERQLKDLQGNRWHRHHRAIAAVEMLQS